MTNPTPEDLAKEIIRDFDEARNHAYTYVKQQEIIIRALTAAEKRGAKRVMESDEAAKRLVEALKFSIRSFVSLTRGNRFDASFEIKMIQEALAAFQKLREKELK